MPMFTDFFHKKAEVKEYFIALKIGGSSVGASIFSVKDGKASIAGLSYESYSGDWNELIEITDTAITKAAKTMDLKNIKKAVFGFPPTFLEGNKIKKEILPNLKKLTTELDLTPSGFVVIPEAINFYLEEKDSGPQTVILIGASKEELIVSLFRGGKLSGQTVIERSDKITADIENALKYFTDVEIFPSKILLYDGDDLNKIKEELLQYPWAENSKFIHFPKIETLSYEMCLTSIAQSAASELNKSMNGIEGLNDKEQIVSPKQETSESFVSKKQVDASELGFIREEAEPPVKPVKDEVENKKFKISLPKISLPRPVLLGKNKLLFFIIIFIGFLFFGGFVFASSYLPRATLKLIVDPKVYEEEKTVTINPNITTPQEDKSEIPGKQLSAQVSSSKSVPATGKKLVGDLAKGSVTIYNKSTSSRSFDKGTKISTKNLVFTLDNKVDVKAATDTGTRLEYGAANISVTASKIGAEGNLSAQTDLVVEDFSTSSYLARNDQAFSGGSSREVDAVSLQDQNTLLDSLTGELKAQAENNINQQLVEGEKLLKESLSGEIISRKFNHENGEEAKELTLNLDMKYSVMVYQEKDFAVLMEKMVQANIPEGYEFIPKETTVDVASSQNDSGENMNFSARFTAKLFPKFDKESIKKEVSGLSVTKAEEYLRSLNTFAGFEVDIKSPFSLFQSKIPKKINNITIEVASR